MSYREIELLIRTAMRPYRTPDRDDLYQEAWIALLLAQPLYNPSLHACTRKQYLVVKIRNHLSRICARSRPLGEPLLTTLESPDMTPLDAVILAEGIAVGDRN